jgi:hypothetical protein
VALTQQGIAGVQHAIVREVEANHRTVGGFGARVEDVQSALEEEVARPVRIAIRGLDETGPGAAEARASRGGAAGQGLTEAFARLGVALDAGVFARFEEPQDLHLLR